MEQLLGNMSGVINIKDIVRSYVIFHFVTNIHAFSRSGILFAFFYCANNSVY
jgi:hypothetical protein